MSLSSLMEYCKRYWVPDKTGGFKDLTGRSSGITAPTQASSGAITDGNNGLPALRMQTDDYYREMIADASHDLAFTGRHVIVWFGCFADLVRAGLFGKNTGIASSAQFGSFMDFSLSGAGAMNWLMYNNQNVYKTSVFKTGQCYSIICSFSGDTSSTNMKVYVNGLNINASNDGARAALIQSCVGFYWELGRYPSLNGLYTNSTCYAHLVFADPLNGTGHLIDDATAKQLDSLLRRRTYLQKNVDYYHMFPYSSTQLKRNKYSLYMTGTCDSFLGDRYSFAGAKEISFANASDIVFGEAVTIVGKLKISSPRAGQNVIIGNGGLGSEDGFCLSYYQPGNFFIAYVQNQNSAFSGIAIPTEPVTYILKIKRNSYKSLTVLGYGSSSVDIPSDTRTLNNGRFALGAYKGGETATNWNGEAWPPLIINGEVSDTEAISLWKMCERRRRS